MRPASSKHRQQLSLPDLEQQLTNQIKRLNLLEGDRAEFKRQAEDTQSKNNEWIEKLKQENHNLKQMRDEMLSKRRSYTTAQPKLNMTVGSISIKNEQFIRRELDKQKHLTKTLKNCLMNMQDKLKDVQNNKISYIEESPMMRNIRILENRLDKIMIKYNEANSMRETYEQIVKRLKEQRIGYDNQITAIERSLKGKESDFEQLLLLAHDASHAKELAMAELKKFEHKRSAIKDLRDQYITEKKKDVDQNKPQPNQIADSRIMAGRLQLADTSQGNLIDDEQAELEEYEQAFKKLKQVTGVNDANQIIQKFKTQGSTTKSLEELRERYKIKIEGLKKQRVDIREKLNRMKYQGSREPRKKKVDDLQNQLYKLQMESERSKVKYEKLSKMLVNVKVAIEHLNGFFDFMPSGRPAHESVDSEVLLSEIDANLNKVYKQLKMSPNFNSEMLKQSTQGLEKYINKGGELGRTSKKTKIFQEEEDSANEYDEEMDDGMDKNRIKLSNVHKKEDRIVRNYRKFKA